MTRKRSALVDPRPGTGITEPTQLLMIADEQWWIRSIETILAPSGFTVSSVPAVAQALESIQESMPGAVIVQSRLQGAETIDDIRTLRDFGLEPTVPMLLLARDVLPRDERLAALRAGAWECVHPPVDAEELILKLSRYLSAKRVADAMRQQALIDAETGLYSAYGILRRIREMGHSAQRYHRALGCAVFALHAHPDDESAAPGEAADEEGSIVSSIGQLLVSQGRTSDVIGRLNRREFVVVAPETDPEGIVTMAHRFVEAGASMLETKFPPRRELGAFHAGCYAVRDLAAEEINPVDLIVRATTALRRVQSQGAPVTPIEFFSPRRN